MESSSQQEFITVAIALSFVIIALSLFTQYYYRNYNKFKGIYRMLLAVTVAMVAFQIYGLYILKQYHKLDEHHGFRSPFFDGEGLTKEIAVFLFLALILIFCLTVLRGDFNVLILVIIITMIINTFGLIVALMQESRKSKDKSESITLPSHVTMAEHASMRDRILNLLLFYVVVKLAFVGFIVFLLVVKFKCIIEVINF